MKNIMKTIYFIRHGEATHNVDAIKMGDRAYYLERNRDSSLTPKGINQACNVQNIDVDIVITSPLTRTIQTSLNIFGHDANNIKASDIIRECNYEHVCNNRKPKSILQDTYKNIDFSDIHEEDIYFINGDNFDRVKELDNFLEQLEHDKIAIVSHFSYLNDYFKYKQLGNIYLNNCEVVKCTFQNNELKICQ